MFDTHCHLNFKAFEGRVEAVIDDAKKVGVNYFVVPGTDVETSKKAVEIAEEFEGVYAAVGIHPHHIYQYQKSNIKDQKKKERHPEFISGSDFRKQMLNPNYAKATMGRQVQHDIQEIEKLIFHPKVVAVGEVGLDRHIYKKTVYQDYQVDQEFIELQKYFFIEQIKLAHIYKKALIIHNREVKDKLLKILTTNYELLSTVPAVFHCCEPEDDLLEFAKRHKVYIGVDGDVTYRKDKQEFIKKIPLDLLVLETDSPFLSPKRESLPAGRQVPNQPKNLEFIASFITDRINISKEKLVKKTEENGRKLFGINYSPRTPSSTTV